MTIPQFRSTAAFTRRQRSNAPTIDRATFVIFALGQRRVAVPVESVERVLRHDALADHAVVDYAGRHVPVIDIARALGLAVGHDTHGDKAPHTRTLILSVQGQWVAAMVDAVFEVAIVDAAIVQPLPATMIEVWTDLSAVPWPNAARGVMTRANHAVVVLDIARVLRALFELDQPTRIGAGAHLP